ncbi:MAG: sigma-70 family RNA polymerase sigma factor [Myxococcota bacterium]
MVDLTQDRALLEAYRRGEKAALERIFRHHGAEVARWASGGFSFKSGEESRRFDGFRSAVDVHDVVHEVFRAVFEERARTAYSGLTPFGGYLFVVTKNVVLKRLSQRDRTRALEPETLEALPDQGPSPEERATEREEAGMVQEYLATLSEEERRFVELRFVDELAQVEVGERMGWTRKKVRIQEASVRQGLMRFLLRRRGTKELTEVQHDGAR